MDHQLPRLPRQAVGSAEAAFLIDPETGAPVVYSTVVAGTPGGAVADILFDVDLSAAQSAVVQLFGTFAGTTQFEQTLDGVSWFSVIGLAVGSKAAGVVASTGVGAWCFPAIGKRMRARVSAFTSGSIQSNVCLSNVPAAALENGSTLSANITVDAQANAGGLSVAKVRTLATTNLTLVGTGARRCYGWRLFNNAAAPRYLKFYNKATAPVASDVPIFTLVLAPGVVSDFESTHGISLSAGLGYAITGGLADNDTTATAVDDVVGMIIWK
ncbi:hypothetical protein [Caulobacter sp.]|uniref:hypothetical protein n=1 Tax=Caulobacter sp. TaxID=78 RepID=UPI0031D95AD6